MQERSAIARATAVAAAERAATLLVRDPRVRLVYLFGSAVDPLAATVRDVDMGVLFEPAATFDDVLRVQADLIAAAGVPIDLVALDGAPIVLTHEIAETGRCLYADPPERETEFVVRARARYWNWKPFLDEQWRCLGERLEERRGPAT